MQSAREAAVTMVKRLGLLPLALRVHRRSRNRVRTIVASSRGASLRRQYDVDASTQRWVDLGSIRWLCRVENSTSIVSVMTDNLRVVAAAFEAHDVTHFFVPQQDPSLFRLGVPIEQRAAAWQALISFELPPETAISPGDGPLRAAQQVAYGASGSPPRDLMGADVWTVWRPVTDPSGARVLDHRHGCEVEFWKPAGVTEAPLLDRADGSDGPGESPLVCAAAWNTVSTTIRRDRVAESAVDVGGCRIPAPLEYVRAHEASTRWFPIDVVYTWVNDQDPAWFDRFRSARARAGSIGADSGEPSRFANRDELRYSLRSLHHFADFVRNVYLVTDQQVPEWLDSSVPGLRVVDHRELLEGNSVLPTFNSHAIEANLHRIDGLSDQYLYLNDDVFFGRRVTPATFFHPSGMSKFFLSQAQIPLGASVPGEPSVDSAAKNGRDLVWQEFGRLPTQKFKHTPHAQRRVIHEEIEQRFTAALHHVRNAPFRSHTDVSVASSLHHHVGDALGLATEGSIQYDYVQLTTKNLEGRLDRLGKGTFDTFCLNDVAAPPDRRIQIDAMIRASLERTFPWPSPWERTGS